MENENINQFEEVTDFITTFKTWCHEGYSLLEADGLVITNDEEKESAYLALRRMLALFIDEEEYEKCQVVKRVLDENFEEDKSPLFDYKEA